MKLIKLTLGKEAVIDDADFPAVCLYKWHAERTKSGNFYAATTIMRDGRPTTLRMHQVILCVPDRFEVDHKDGNGLNNRRQNLRAATRLQQSHNTKGRRHNRKGVTKLTRLKKRPWHARIAIAGEQIHIGYFATEEEAATAYDIAAKQLHGEFARLNGTSVELSDNKLRKIISIKESVEPQNGKNGRRAGHVSVNLDCGHTIQAPLSQSSKFQKYSHCEVC